MQSNYRELITGRFSFRADVRACLFSFLVGTLARIRLATRSLPLNNTFMQIIPA